MEKLEDALKGMSLYKIYTKALQARLQPVLMEVIDLNQSSFLPLRFILDNIMLTHETIDWAEHTKHPFKIDFTKAFDIVNWDFFIRAMAILGIPQVFITMTNMLLLNTQAMVKINGSHSPRFQIKRGVRYGFPFASYRFLITAKFLNVVLKRSMTVGDIKGITLPSGIR